MPKHNSGIKYNNFYKELFILLFMTIFSQTFFAFMCCNFMTFSFLTTRHTLIFKCVKTAKHIKAGSQAVSSLPNI